MIKKGLLPIGVLGAGLVLALMAAAQDRTTKESGRPGTEVGMHSYTGRIARVDADKRTIELKDVRTAGSATKDSGTTTKDAGSKDDGSKGLRTMTFHVGERARITLDGKAATFSELGADAWARVYTAARGTVRDKDAGTTGKDAGIGLRMMEAERVEAFTREPGTKGTAGEKDKDR